MPLANWEASESCRSWRAQRFLRTRSVSRVLTYQGATRLPVCAHTLSLSLTAGGKQRTPTANSRRRPTRGSVYASVLLVPSSVTGTTATSVQYGHLVRALLRRPRRAAAP